MRSSRRRPARALTGLSIAVAAGLGLSACGTSTIKTDQVESTIVKQFAAQGVKLTDVDCEDGVKAEVDARINCTALNPTETKLVLEGKVTKIDGDKGSFQVKAVRGIAKGTVVAEQAKMIYDAQVGETARAFTCPAEVPLPTTPSVTCKLTAEDGKTSDAKVTVDAQNQLRVEVADASK
ncbi:DUF4333 domain-containing protein [Patulibacter sp.]|uniref:DUF4333 domain-containing protein n=1 Tax=Patulibacter sp. TaxID=1912859 RepID=UPI00271E17C7|nr:DUF4333 domain-containing protein [Patulibacter sp.]MDO9407686.1 DUF4333 domain-containing protein [Patulibacter sp.]